MAYHEMLKFADRDKGSMYDERAKKYDYILRKCVGWGDPEVACRLPQI